MANRKFKKRTPVRGEAAIDITITEKEKRDGPYSWTTYFVQGWKENGMWQRRQFKSRRDAEVFAADKRIALENAGRAQKLMLCPLTQEQLDEAVRAVEGLGSTYSLTEAVDFFLKHHRAPDYTIAVSDAMRHYLDDRERDGLRPTTLKGLRSVISSFSRQSRDPQVHEVTPETVEQFLRSLRAKDGTNKASKKSWNNYRNDLNKFFSWCREPDKSTDLLPVCGPLRVRRSGSISSIG